MLGAMCRWVPVVGIAGSLGSLASLGGRAATEVGILTIGRYTDHFQMVGIFKIGVKMP